MKPAVALKGYCQWLTDTAQASPHHPRPEGGWGLVVAQPARWRYDSGAAQREAAAAAPRERHASLVPFHVMAADIIMILARCAKCVRLWHTPPPPCSRHAAMYAHARRYVALWYARRRRERHSLAFTRARGRALTRHARIEYNVAYTSAQAGQWWSLPAKCQPTRSRPPNWLQGCGSVCGVVWGVVQGASTVWDSGRRAWEGAGEGPGGMVGQDMA